MDDPYSPGPRPAAAFNAWVLWFAILSGFMIILFLIGKGFPSGEDNGSPPVVLVGAPAVLAFASLVVRVVLIPRAKSLMAALPLMIVGLALAEGAGMISIFAISSDFPHTKLLLIIAAITCLMAQAPIYASDKSA